MVETGWLTTWKKIAEYIGRNIVTTQMYANRYHMPVRRLPRGTPTAIPAELDEWLVQFDEIRKKKNKKK